MRARLWLPMLLLSLTAGCKDAPAGDAAHAKPGTVVAAWIAAVDGQDFARVVALSPPGLDETQTAELKADLATRLKGAKRLDEVPFTMSDPDVKGEAMAKVTFELPGKGQKALPLTVKRVDGKWYVVPPRIGEIDAW